MKRVGLWAAMGLGLFITMGLTTVATSHAEEHECTLKTLKGRYLFAQPATLFPPAFGVTGPTPANAAGFHIFNGDGTGTDIVTFRPAGVTVLENAVAPFSYTVNADCTGSYTVVNGPSFGMFVAPNGESVAIIATAPPGNLATDISPRVSRR